MAKLADLKRDLATLTTHLADWPPAEADPWDALWRWGESALTLEGQEQLASLLLEPHGGLVDGLACCMEADEAARFPIDGARSVADLREGLARDYGWALTVDYDAPEASARFWYVSQEKLEPRLGERFSEDGAAREQPLGIGRLAADLARDLADRPGEETVAAFLLARPQHRQMVRRAGLAASHPYAEIRDNLLGADMLPIDILRCKLAFFGATHFDPRSDRWVRISLFQGAPYPDTLAGEPMA